jgi:DNA end-binding protein Ku
MAPRSLWSGSLSFGLVNVPVRLHSGVRDHDLHFHELHEKDGAPIETRRFCEKEDKEVDYDEIAHGYELDDGTQVIVTDEELEAVAPRKTHTIEIASFTDLDQIDPILFDHPYFLVPAGDGDGPKRAYQLLVKVMEGAGQVALGRFVLRTKESLVAIRVRDGLLALSTMRFADEVRDPKGIDTGGSKPPAEQLKQAVKLVEALGSDWDPERYDDEYRKRLQNVVKRKKGGKKVEAPKREEAPQPASDLMAALEKSLADVRG